MGLSESIGPMIEKIEKLSKVVRIVICSATFVLILVPFVLLSYMPQYKKIGEMEVELKGIEKELAIAKKKASELAKVQKDMEEAEIKLDIAKKALPESDEIPLLLTNISNAGQDAGLEFILFEPAKIRKKKKSKKKKKKEEDVPFYAEIPISMEVAGNYHNVAFFFDKVSRLNRIVNIKDIKVTLSKGAKSKKKSAAKENELLASCRAITYKFLEGSD